MTATAKKKTSAPRPEKGQKTLLNATFMQKYGFVINVALAFFLPFLFMFVAFMAAGVEPFGTKQILVTDLWHQYYPFLVDFHDKLRHGGSFLWTWKSGGGTNYIALISYYLASPLNFLSVFVPAEHLKEFLYVITCVKIGLAGMFFALFLKLTFRRRDISITAFGMMYALCAFIMGYYWNVIWLDTIALLPLVIAGTFALLRHGRFKLYILSLALSVLANYYIGLFTCVFVLLVSIGYSIVEYKGWRNLLRNFLKMAGSTVVALMMTAVLTLPAYFALGHTHSSENAFPEGFSVNMGSSPDLMGVLEGVGKTISNSVAFIQPTAKEGLPNIYCGVFTIFLAILFLFCSKIKKRERIVCGGMLIFFVLSFVIRQLDFIWHGFHFPNMLPYRFSFLYSFVLIYMAFRVYMHIDSIKPVSAIAAIFGFLIYLGVVTKYFDTSSDILSYFSSGGTLEGTSFIDGIIHSLSEASLPVPVILSGVIGLFFGLWVLLYSFRTRIPKALLIFISVLIALAAVVMLIISRVILRSLLGTDNNHSVVVTIVIGFVIVLLAVALIWALNKISNLKMMPKAIFSVVLIIIAITEGLFSAAIGVRTVSVTDATTYPLGTDNTLECVAYAKELEENIIDLPRTEVNKYHTLNDNALIGANGISMFNSMVNRSVTNYMQKFGICGWVASNRYTYQEGTPFTNLMLNIKYLIAPYGAYLDTNHNSLIHEAANVKLMRNNYYLPQGFMVDDDLLDYNVDAVGTADPMANQNQIFNLATGIEGDLYEYLDPSSTASGDGSYVTQNSSRGSFSYTLSNSSGNVDISYTVPEDGTAVAYFDTFYSDNVSIKVNGAERISYYIKCPFIMMVGGVKAGDTVTLTSGISNSTSGSVTAYCAMFNDELFNEAYEQLSRSTLNAIEVTDTKLAGHINVAEDGLFYTSVSYVDGWRAFVDGQEVEITPVGGALLAFHLSAGNHYVELRYIPEGFTVGLAVSLFAVVIFILMILAAWKREQLAAFVTARLKKASPTTSADTPEEAAADNDTDETDAPSEVKDPDPEADASAPEENETSEPDETDDPNERSENTTAPDADIPDEADPLS